jgi:SPP1 gp7 family putative phage head morphogenesis protein
VPTRAQRRAGALRAPGGAILRYRLALRQVAGTFAAVVRRVIVPEIERFAPPPEARTDAADGDARYLVDKARAVLAGAAGKVGPSADTVGDRVIRHSKSEFKRLGINLRKEEPKFNSLIAGWRRENVELIKSLVDRELGTIQNLLSDGEGRRVESLAGDIEERLRVTRSKAELLARDQVLKLNAKVTGERQKAAGIEEYIWTASGDERVRERHAELDGKKFSWDDPPVTNEDGETNHPGEDYQCRCTAYPVLSELGDDLGEAGEDEEPAEPVEPVGEEPTPEPEPGQSSPEPLAARAVELIGLLARSPGDARELVREQIARAMPLATSKDLGKAGAQKLSVQRLPMGVNAYHSTETGEVAVSGDTFRKAKAAAKYLADGVYGEGFRDIDPIPGKVGPIEALNGLRTVVHEEVHGHSRVGLHSYRGVGRVLEEVGTESTARHVVRNLTPEIAANPHLRSPNHFGSYHDEIDQVRITLMRHVGVDEDGADELIRKAHRDKVCASGLPFATPDQHLDAFLEGLDQPAETTQLVRRELLIRFR